MCDNNNKFNQNYELKNGETLTLRTPEVSDAEALVEQVKLVDRETRFLAREPDEFTFTVEQEVEFIEGCLSNKYKQFLVAVIDGEIIGNCAVESLHGNRRMSHRAVMGIALVKEHWGKGIGKKMMQETINWCKKMNLEQLELEVVTDNARGVALYESLGFEICGTKKNAMKYSDGTYADEYQMTLFL